MCSFCLTRGWFPSRYCKSRWFRVIKTSRKIDFWSSFKNVFRDCRRQIRGIAACTIFYLDVNGTYMCFNIMMYSDMCVVNSRFPFVSPSFVCSQGRKLGCSPKERLYHQSQISGLIFNIDLSWLFYNAANVQKSIFEKQCCLTKTQCFIMVTVHFRIISSLPKVQFEI